MACKIKNNHASNKSGKIDDLSEECDILVFFNISRNVNKDDADYFFD